MAVATRMASTDIESISSSVPFTPIPRPQSTTYDVFLSFCGKDTRNGFTDHLYEALTTKGVRTFRDDNDLQRGGVISAELMKAIEESKFAIIVLSPNYASSTWCLDELQKIIECRNEMGLYVLPVFYDVEASDVRYQRASFEVAFGKHGERFGHSSDKIQRWRDAFTQVAGYSGWDSKHRPQSKLVERITQYIHKHLIPELPSCIEDLVGIHSRVNNVLSLLSMELNDVRFIGICGMGGIGKTTIARAVYEHIQAKFQVGCFVRGVREVSKTCGIVHLQRYIVSHLNADNHYFYDIQDGRKIIRMFLCKKKVLLVLDDVSEISQLVNLAGNQDWFGPGSRVIITTRDFHLLRIHQVIDTYHVGCLCQNEALRLFCLKAFQQDHPKEGYWDLSKEIVKYTDGLPLALETLGSYLFGRSVEVWRSAIKKIKSAPHEGIDNILKISYDTLDFAEKNIFLDIACFFRGMNVDEVTNTLDHCGYDAGIGIDILIDRCLVTVNQGKTLEMHDLHQKLGKDLILQESPDDPGKRSRLWSREDIDHVLTNDKGSEAIQGIVLSSCYVAHWSTGAFSKTSQLKLLSLYGLELPFGLSYLSSSLKVLHWEHCPLKTLPLADQPYEVVEMKLRHSVIKQLWHGKKFLEKLKHLDLSFSEELQQTPDLSGAPMLETLVLVHCSSLNEVHPSLADHKKLVLLNLSGCNSLKTLPGKLEMCSLEQLILSHCWSLENLPEFGECMKHLFRLALNGTIIKILPTSIGSLVGLSALDLTCCIDLIFLPHNIDGLKSLSNLNASWCSTLRGLPTDLIALKHFEKLYDIRLELPPSFASLPLLRSLDLSYCYLSEGEFPLDFCHFPSLMKLNLSRNCFVSVPISIHKFPMLSHLWLNHCPNLQYLPELPSSMVELEAWDCDSLDTSEFNPLSKAYNVFAAHSQDSGHVFSMVISGRKIPSCFVQQQDGNNVSVPNNCSPNERVGIVLCFLLQISGSSCGSFAWSLSIHTDKRFITKTMLHEMEPGFRLYVVCLTNDYFNGEFCQDNCFELLAKDSNDDLKILSSGACWVRKQDIEHLSKSIESMPESEIFEVDREEVQK